MSTDINTLAIQTSQLLTNYGNLFKTYYDMFYNTEPIDITVQLFDDNNVLQTYTVPNRTKFLDVVLSGEGSPEGAVTADIGTIYLNILNKDLYVKTSGLGTHTGWEIFKDSSKLPLTGGVLIGDLIINKSTSSFVYVYLNDIIKGKFGYNTEKESIEIKNESSGVSIELPDDDILKVRSGNKNVFLMDSEGRITVGDSVNTDQAVTLGQLNNIKGGKKEYSVNYGNTDPFGYADLMYKINNSYVGFKVGKTSKIVMLNNTIPYNEVSNTYTFDGSSVGLKLNKETRLSTGNTQWEIITPKYKFHDTTSHFVLLHSDNNYGLNISRDKDNTIYLQLSSSDASWDVVNGYVDSIGRGIKSDWSIDSEYIFKITYSGNTYIVSYSEDDGITWNIDISIEVSTNISNMSKYLLFGINSDLATLPFKGTMNFDSLEVTIGNLSKYSPKKYVNTILSFPNGNSYELSYIYSLGSVAGNGNYTVILEEDSLIKREDKTYIGIASFVKTTYKNQHTALPVMTSNSQDGWTITANKGSDSAYKLFDRDNNTLWDCGTYTACTEEEMPNLFPTITNPVILQIDSPKTIKTKYITVSTSSCFVGSTFTIELSNNHGASFDEYHVIDIPWSTGYFKPLKEETHVLALPDNATTWNNMKITIVGANNPIQEYIGGDCITQGLQLSTLNIFEEFSFTGGRVREEHTKPKLSSSENVLMDFTESLTKDYYGNLVTVVGNPTNTNGVYNGDGSGDGLNCSSIKTFGTGKWTFECFCKFGVLGTDMAFISTIGLAYALQVHKSAANVIKLYLSSNGTSWNLVYDLAGTKNNYNTTDYYHFAFEFDLTSYKIYVNGSPDVTFMSSNTIHQTISSIVFNATDTYTSSINGSVSDIRLTLGRNRYGTTFTPPKRGSFKPEYDLLDGDYTLYIGRKPNKPTLRLDGADVERQFVKLGEFSKISSTIGTPITYNFNGLYRSELKTCQTLASTQFTFPHNLGTRRVTPKLYFKCVIPENNYVVDDIITWTNTGDITQYTPSIANNNVGYVSTSTANSKAFSAQNKMTGTIFQATPANWRMYSIVEREF